MKPEKRRQAVSKKEDRRREVSNKARTGERKDILTVKQPRCKTRESTMRTLIAGFEPAVRWPDNRQVTDLIDGHDLNIVWWQCWRFPKKAIMMTKMEILEGNSPVTEDSQYLSQGEMIGLKNIWHGHMIFFQLLHTLNKLCITIGAVRIIKCRLHLLIDCLGSGPWPSWTWVRTGPTGRSEGPGQRLLARTSAEGSRSSYFTDRTLGVGPGPDLDLTFIFIVNLYHFCQVESTFSSHFRGKRSLKLFTRRLLAASRFGEFFISFIPCNTFYVSFITS